ncbi:MAG: alpha/beta hydrolase, partial [Comamonadaceae bacterium]
FLHDATPRSGEQAAFGADLLAFLDALAVPRAVLAGYDWGGRAACVVAALWPERCAGLVSLNSYNIFDHARALEPDTPENERKLWYQYYFHNERGRAGLQKDRRALTRLLWETWSPTWRFDDATFERSAAAFDHPDFVDVVIHSYRHRYNLVPGDPAYAAIERRLAAQPPITVPAITFDGADDGVRPPAPASAHAHRFTGPREHRLVPGAGHNLPQEAPQPFAQAVLELVRRG